MQSKLEKHLNAQEDRVRIYMICEICLTKIETVGLAQPKEATIYLF